MADVTRAPRTKDFGSTSIQCPMLSSTNYTVWSMRMKVLLRVHEVWDTIEPGSDDQKKNDVAIALLFQSVPETLILQVGEQTASKEIWNAIKSRHLGADRVREARLQTLMTEFDRLKMDDSDTVDDFAGKISGLSSKATSLGENIEESKMVKKFLKGLPRHKYIQIVASLEQVLDLNSTGFEDIVGRLKAYEERVGEETQKEDQGKLMFSNNEEHSQRGYENSRGRGRGRNGRGRGRGRSHNQNRASHTEDNNSKKNRSKLICWRCDKPGHYATVCPEKTEKNQETNLNETEEADALYVHEVVFLNEDKVIPKNLDIDKGNASVWYLDNGASNHMTGNKEFFSSLNLNTKGKVKFGDGSCVDIVGKGVVTFVCKTGEKKALKDIYYIPDLKHNILSLGQATENGCEVNMKDVYLTLTDSHGRLLVRVTRSPNRLYKTPMEISYPECLHVRDEDATWRWHARQGHICYGVMNNMVRKEMVVGMQSVTHEEGVCDTCLAEKQTRHSFPSVTHKEGVCDTCLAGKQARDTFLTKAMICTSKPVRLLLGNLCGCITPPTPADNREAFYRFKRSHTDRGGEVASAMFNLGCTDRGGEVASDVFNLGCTDRGGEIASDEFNLSCEEDWVEAMEDELESITRNKIWELVDRPTGSEKKREEDRVCVLHKTLHVLRQAPRAWSVKLDQVLKEMRFEKCTKEPSVYCKTEGGDVLIIAIYVDDLFVTGTSLKMIRQFKEEMSKKFEMSDLGKLTYYLGIEVIQGADRIRIKQERYAQGILCDTKMEVCNTTHEGVCNTTHRGVCDTKVEACDTTHVPMKSRFSKDEDEPEIKLLGVEQKADIFTRAHVRKMADVTRVIIAVNFSHKTHRNLSEEVMRRLYKNWADSKKKRYGSKESIRSNLEKDVNSMGGFAHHGVVEDDYLMIKFKQMRSLIGVQEIDLPNSSWN